MGEQKIDSRLKNFEEHYLQFLELNSVAFESGARIFNSPNRKITFSFYYIQYLIVTTFQGRIVFSQHPDYHSEFVRIFENNNEKYLSEALFQQIDDFFMDYNIQHRMQRMLRFSADASQLHTSENLHQVEALSDSTKELFFQLFKKRGMKYKEKQWEIFKNVVREGRFFYLSVNNQIASYAYISDIVENGGNIVVATSPEFRNQGFGKAVVSTAKAWCFEHGVVPVYLVSCENTPSIRLAESLGFDRKAEEIIVSSFLQN